MSTHGADRSVGWKPFWKVGWHHLVKSRPCHPISQQLLSGTYHRRRGHVGSGGRQERLATTQMSLQRAWTDIHTSDAVPGGRVPHSPLQQRGGIVSVERRASARGYAEPGPGRAKLTRGEGSCRQAPGHRPPPRTRLLVPRKGPPLLPCGPSWSCLGPGAEEPGGLGARGTFLVVTDRFRQRLLCSQCHLGAQCGVLCPLVPAGGGGTWEGPRHLRRVHGGLAQL